MALSRRPPFFLFLSRLALVIGRTDTHACTNTYANTRARVRTSKARERKRRTRLKRHDDFDQRPSRGSSIAATKRVRTRPLVFIRVLPAWCLVLTVRLSLSLSPPPPLSFAPHPPPQCRDEHAYVRGREDTHEIPLILMTVQRRLWTRRSSPDSAFTRPFESEYRLHDTVGKNTA